MQIVVGSLLITRVCPSPTTQHVGSTEAYISRKWLIDLSIRVLYDIECNVALYINPEPGFNTYLFDWSQDTFIVHVPIDSSTHYPAFYTVG